VKDRDWPILDMDGNAIAVGDCVERKGDRFAVMGLIDVCNEDVVVLGSLVGGKLETPYCERAEWLRKVDI